MFSIVLYPVFTNIKMCNHKIKTSFFSARTAYRDQITGFAALSIQVFVLAQNLFITKITGICHIDLHPNIL